MDAPMPKTYFAPHLYIPNGVHYLEFYLQAFAAVELRRWMNEDGSYHVAELAIAGNVFHVHEQVTHKQQYDPLSVQGTTVAIGLFVEDVDAIIQTALAAGGTLISPAQDYDYGYRQAMIRDPFGHQWLIEAIIS